MLSCQSVLGAVTYESATAFVNSQSVGGGSLSSSTARGDYPVFTANTRQAVVVGSGVAGFNGSVSVAHRNATVKSMLFAQFVSDAWYNKQTETIDWYSKYFSILSQLGWSPTASALSPREEIGTDIQVAPIVEDLMASYLCGDQSAVLASQLQALDNDGAAYQLLQNQSTAGNHTTFQVAVAGENAAGVLSLPFSAAFFAFSSGNFLWSEAWLVLQANYDHVEQAMALDDTVYPAAAIDNQTRYLETLYVIDLHIAQ